MKQSSPFKPFIQRLRAIATTFPDQRNGQNKRYTLVDAALGAFAVFFPQSPSFLAHQRAMQARTGQSNAHTLFGLHAIPCDNQIRTLLDPVSPEPLVPLFHPGLAQVEQTGPLTAFRSWQNRVLVVLDGPQFFSSQKISWPHCSTQPHPNSTTTYSHKMLTPVMGAPGQEPVLPLPPEFMTPQDGHDKQDCETAAAKRWVRKYAPYYRATGITILGDDLDSTHPMSEVRIEEGLPFILVCKPESHPPLSQHLAQRALGKDLHQVTVRRQTTTGREIYTYRYALQLPLRATTDTVRGNWCELTITTAHGEPRYHTAFVTQEKITRKTVAQVVMAGRTRWKVENENNNTLKTNGYHLEHNCGHGKQHLASLLATFNLLAFLLHTLLALQDAKSRVLRHALGRRQTFFDDLPALTRYVCFASWGELLAFMLDGLEIAIPPNSS